MAPRSVHTMFHGLLSPNRSYILLFQVGGFPDQVAPGLQEPLYPAGEPRAIWLMLATTDSHLAKMPDAAIARG